MNSFSGEENKINNTSNENSEEIKQYSDEDQDAFGGTILDINFKATIAGDPS